MKLRKSGRKWIIVIILIVIVLSASFLLAYYFNVRQYKANYEFIIHEKENFIESNKRYTYVSTIDIKAGESLSLENVMYQEIYSSESQENFMDRSDLNKVAIVNINAGMSITKTMLTDILKGENNSREIQYSIFPISTNISIYDYVDLRIAYPNGETYVVLSKKRMVDISENLQDCILWLTPEEINRMQSCIVDTYLFPNTELFLTKYIEPNIQKASIITYTPSIQTIELIKNDPNIVTLASDSLSNQVRGKLEIRVKKAIDKEESNDFMENEMIIQKQSKDSVKESSIDNNVIDSSYDDQYFKN